MTSQPFRADAHHSTVEDSYGVTIQLTRSDPFSRLNVTLQFDEFLLLMDTLDEQRAQIIAERQARADAEAAELEVAA